MEKTIIVDNFRLSAGGILIDEERQMVCLIKDTNSNEYLLPKGGKKSFETIPEAAQREIFEETGYENIVVPENLLGIQFRPNIFEKPEHKVVYWYYSKSKNGIFHEGTQDENESFCSEWLSLTEAIEKLGFEEDRILVIRAFQTMTGSKIDLNMDCFHRWQFNREILRCLTNPSTSICKRFVAGNFDRKMVLLSFDDETDSWCLPNEENIEFSKFLRNKVPNDCASPLFFELKLDGKISTINMWYPLDLSNYDLKDINMFDLKDAANRLKNNLIACKVVEGVFKKFEEQADPNDD